MNMLKRLRRDISSLLKADEKLERIQEALGRIESRQIQQVCNADHSDISRYEFRVFSQWGEDGIIQYLVDKVDIKKKIFVEFGVQNYTEANTRYLLVNNNWAGLVIDSDKEFIRYIRSDQIYWKYNVKAACEFITKDNINSIIADNGVSGEIGLLSIDIDGNDYWVWEAIHVVNPTIVVIEYNHRFGAEKAVTIPYDEKFIRSSAHHSAIYYGASLGALCILAKRKGYAFVGCNSAGNNAFFIRRDLKPDCIKELTVAEGFVSGLFHESRDEKGNLNFLSAKEEQELLSTLPLAEVR